jgi:hypothetical protein
VVGVEPLALTVVGLSNLLVNLFDLFFEFLDPVVRGGRKGVSSVVGIGVISGL